MKHIEINSCVECPYFREYDNKRSKRKDFYCRLSKVPIVLGVQTSFRNSVSQQVPDWCQLPECAGPDVGINLDPMKESWIELSEGLPEFDCQVYCEVRSAIKGRENEFSTLTLDYEAFDKKFTYTGEGHVGLTIENVVRYKILPIGKNK